MFILPSGQRAEGITPKDVATLATPRAAVRRTTTRTQSMDGQGNNGRTGSHGIIDAQPYRRPPQASTALGTRGSVKRTVSTQKIRLRLHRHLASVLIHPTPEALKTTKSMWERCRETRSLSFPTLAASPKPSRPVARRPPSSTAGARPKRG